MKITKATRKTTLGNPRHRWENVINICLKKWGGSMWPEFLMDSRDRFL